MGQMIRVKAHPKAKFQRVEKRGDNDYEVWTTAPADQGRANAAVAKLLAEVLGVAPSRLVLRRGAHAREKLFEILD